MYFYRESSLNRLPTGARDWIYCAPTHCFVVSKLVDSDNIKRLYHGRQMRFLVEMRGDCSRRISSTSRDQTFLSFFVKHLQTFSGDLTITIFTYWQRVGYHLKISITCNNCGTKNMYSRNVIIFFFFFKIKIQFLITFTQILRNNVNAKRYKELNFSKTRLQCIFIESRKLLSTSR